MRLAIVALFCVCCSGAAMRTMRLDYFHTGNATEEVFALDGVVLEAEWAGPRDRRIDETDLGKYFFEVREAASDRVLYSRGFASMFGEWETTDEAKEVRRIVRTCAQATWCGRAGVRTYGGIQPLKLWTTALA